MSHADFWVAVAAAAPVIALASAVTINDTVGIWFSARPEEGTRFALFGSWLIGILSAVNLVAQGVVLYIALRSLLHGRDALIPAGAIGFLEYGLFVVLLTVAANANTRKTLRQSAEAAAPKASRRRARAARRARPAEPPAAS